MNSKIAVAVGLAAVLAAMLVPVSFSPAFAADVAVSITTGSASKTTNAFDPNPVNANVGDTVTWTNKDTQPHTVTSGSNGKPDGKFSSTNPDTFTPLLSPQKTYTVKFNQTGDYSYYCMLHPNMVGTVHVASGSSGGPSPTTVKATLDGKSYDVTSTSATSKITAATIQSGKSVTVTFDKAGDVQLTLPKTMISGTLKVMAGVNTVQSTSKDNGDTTTLTFTLPAGTTSVDITGTTVVPEFSVIAALVLAISIAALVGYSRFAKNSGIGFFGRT